MGKLSQEIIVIIGIAISLAVVAIGVICLFIIYRNKQLQAIRETERLKTVFTQQLLQSQLEMQEQTFNTISREIHDNVGQVLSLAKVQLNIIDQSESLDRTLLADAKDSVSKAMTDLRDIAKSLNSERIQLSSLPEITGHELQRINRSGIMLTSISIEGKEQNMQEQKKLIIFRIIQEALHNILKHSQAKNIDVNFCYETDKLKIDITDNGIGFDKELLTKRDGLGLQNIVSRAALIGGEAHVNSIINKGTVITIISPYD
jgi:two-component system, NarL family, sensor kinase